MPITIEAKDNRIFSILDDNQQEILLADGLHFTEGPIWDEKEQRFLFNSIPESQTYSWDPLNKLRKYFPNGTKSNGMFLSRDRRLLICEHATSSVVRREINGSRRKVLADYDGDIEFNSPNDIVERSDGLIYFTDPVFGRSEKPSSVQREIPSDRRAVYMYNPDDGQLKMVADGYNNPNGLAFSPDEKTLYVNDSDDYLIKSYSVTPDGNLYNEKLFALCEGGEENHHPDGLKVDENGNIICACQEAGLYVYDKDANMLGIVRLPGIRVVNFCWGGCDGLDLFMTCDTRVFMIRMKVRGDLNRL